MSTWVAWARRRYIVALVIIVIASLVATMHYYSGSRHAPSAIVANNTRCLIVDGLYDAYPNDTLLSRLKELLVRLGGCQEVDVYRGENASLQVFEHLNKYGIVVLRVHGGYMVRGGGVITGIFTGVPWSSKYLGLARKGYVAEGVPFYPPPRGPKVFVALLSKFFEHRLSGKFPSHSIVIAGGCYTALDDSVAKALCRKGLWLYIGFREKIGLSDLNNLLPLIVKEAIMLRNGNTSAQKALEGISGVKVFFCKGS